MTTPSYTPYSAIPETDVDNMPPLGEDTVIFVDMVRDPNGVPDDMGEVKPVPTDVPVEHCRHRPIPATSPIQRETPEDLVDIGTQVWITHAPPVPAALRAGITGRIKVNGVTYQVLGGAAPVTGAHGTVEFVKILSKVQVG